MLLGQVSVSGQEIAAFAFLFGAVFLMVIVTWRKTRKLTDPRRVGQSPVDGPQRIAALRDFVEFGGARYLLTSYDRQVKAWLVDLVDWWYALRIQERPIRLVRYRPEFRGIIAARPIGGLVSCLSEPDPHLRYLAVWLLGRCCRGVGITAVKSLANHRDPELRRHVAKALRRMGEWTELHAMALGDDEPRVRHAASASSHAGANSYSKRLRRFVQHCGRGEVFEPGHYTSHMPVFMIEPVGSGKPAKTRDLIRRILEHIRELVRSPFKNRAA